MMASEKYRPLRRGHFARLHQPRANDCIYRSDELCIRQYLSHQYQLSLVRAQLGFGLDDILLARTSNGEIESLLIRFHSRFSHVQCSFCIVEILLTGRTSLDERLLAFKLKPGILGIRL
jgi:hypothetical protein